MGTVREGKINKSLKSKSIQFLNHKFILDLAITFRELAWIPERAVTPASRKNVNVYEVLKQSS